MSNDLTILDNNMVGFARAEVDCQVATAKAYPRNVQKSFEEACFLACSDREIADSCIYALPIGNNKVQNGPSVRLAELMLYSWGNIRCSSRIVSYDDTCVIVEAAVWDLEKELHITSPVRRPYPRSKYAKPGEKVQEFVINNTINAAISIAMRNAIFRVIPRTLVNMVYAKAVAVAVGDVASIKTTATKAIEWFNRAGIQTAKILSYFEISSIDEINAGHIETMKGLKNALTDKALTIEQVFVVEEMQDKNERLEDLNKSILGD